MCFWVGLVRKSGGVVGLSWKFDMDEAGSFSVESVFP